MKRIVRAAFGCAGIAIVLDLVEALAAKPGFFWYVDFGWVTFLAYAVMAAVLLQRRLPVAGAFAAVTAAAFTHAVFGPLIVGDVFSLSFGHPWQTLPEAAIHAFCSGVIAGALGLVAGVVWDRHGPLPKPVVDVRTLVVLAVGIVALDAVEAVTSRTTGVAYAALMPVQLVVYLTIGFVLRRRGFTLSSTVLAIAITGLVEDLAGEWVAIAIGVATPIPLAAELAIVPLAAVVFAGTGCIGFALGGLRARAGTGG